MGFRVDSIHLHGVHWSSRCKLVLEDAAENIRVLLGLLATGDLIQRVGLDAKVAGVDAEVLDANLAAGSRLLEHPAVGAARAADFVELLLAADDEGLPAASNAQGVRKGGAKIFPGDANDASLEDVLDRVGQGSDVVEDGPPGQLLTDWCNVAHTCVEDWGEEEGIVGGGIDLAQRRGLDCGQNRWSRLHVVDEIGAS